MENIKYIILAVIAGIIIFMVFANFAKIQKFIAEVIVELKKVSWSSKRELIDATWVVLVSSIALGVYIGSSDFVLSRLLGLLIR